MEVLVRENNIRDLFYKAKEGKDIIKIMNKECLQQNIKNDNLLEFIKGNINLNELNKIEKQILLYSVHEIANDYDDIMSEEVIDIQSEMLLEDDVLEKFLNYKFIGESYKHQLSEDERKSIIKSYDKYKLNKIQMLNEKYKNKKTQITYFTIYQTNIHYLEVEKKKDLMYFTSDEIESLLNSLVLSYNTVKQNILSFMKMYFAWGMSHNYITKNPCYQIQINNVKENNKMLLEDKVFGKSKFYNILKEMEEHTKLPNIIPLLLARYGIIGVNLDKMINLKWEDIDMKNKIVFIKDENDNLICDLPVDDKFIEYINKAKLYEETPSMEGRNLVRYDDFGYVLKKRFKEGDVDEDRKTVKYATIFNRVNIACKSIDEKRISFKKLLLSRQLEILLEMRRHGRLHQSDFEYVITLFNFNEDISLTNKAFQLKKRWIDLTGDKVVTQRKDTRNLEEENNEQVYQEIRDRLDLYV